MIIFLSVQYTVTLPYPEKYVPQVDLLRAHIPLVKSCLKFIL